jgi:hypothetical protein
MLYNNMKKCTFFQQLNENYIYFITPITGNFNLPIEKFLFNDIYANDANDVPNSIK